MACEALFRQAFPKWWTTRDAATTLQRMDAFIEQLLDPNRYHSHLAQVRALTSTPLHRFYTASAPPLHRLRTASDPGSPPSAPFVAPSHVPPPPPPLMLGRAFGTRGADLSEPAWLLWRAKWAHLTGMPLLDTPRLAHPCVRERRSGPGLPPAPFGALGRWGAARLRELGCSSVQGWQVVRTEWPSEALLHLTGVGGRCAHVGRQHASENIMLSIDLLNAIAWQRCWDTKCVVRLECGGYRKARALVGVLPDELMCSQ